MLWYAVVCCGIAVVCCAMNESQEDMFFGALVTLVRNGLTDEDPALKGAYLNSYQVGGSEEGWTRWCVAGVVVVWWGGMSVLCIVVVVR